MASKHSIMLSTDGPDGDASTGKFITPSAHVLAASASKPSGITGTGTQHSSSSASSGDRIITPSSAKTAASSSSSSSASLGFGDEDVSSSSLLPSSLDSVSSRLPFNPSAPRALITSEMTASMSTLSAAFASLMAGDKGEQESKQLEGAINSLQGGAAANTTAGAAPSKLSTCFDLITSTATRIPLSTIIAASASHPSKAAGSAGSAAAAQSSFALDSYVVVEPIDWSRHHHDSTFARLTAVNRGADQVDEIALELAREREQLQQQLEDKDRLIQSQRKQIEALQRQLREALAGGEAASIPPAATSAAAAASASSSSSSAVAAPKRFPNDTSSDDDASEDEDDIDQGMADEEDFRGSNPAATAAASNSSSSAAPSMTTFSG